MQGKQRSRMNALQHGLGLSLHDDLYLCRRDRRKLAAILAHGQESVEVRMAARSLAAERPALHQVAHGEDPHHGSSLGNESGTATGHLEGGACLRGPCAEIDVGQFAYSLRSRMREQAGRANKVDRRTVEKAEPWMISHAGEGEEFTGAVSTAQARTSSALARS